MSPEPTFNIWGGIDLFEIWVLKNPFGHHILDLTIYIYIYIYIIIPGLYDGDFILFFLFFLLLKSIVLTGLPLSHSRTFYINTIIQSN